MHCHFPRPLVLRDAPDLGRTPIPGPDPTGSDPDGTPAFEAVAGEIGKLSQMDGAAVDWSTVVTEGTTVLREVSKDLRVAAYLARGLMEQDGLPGLARGARVLAGIVHDHWDACWPPKRRLRGRVAAFTWLIEKTAPALSARFVDGGDGPVLRDLDETLTALDRQLETLLEDSTPDFTPLTRAVRDKLREAEPDGERRAEEAPAAQGGATAESREPGAQSKAAAAKPAAEPKAAPKLGGLPPLDATSERVVKQVFTEAAAALRPDDLGNPVFYHMVRYATWRGITDVPPTNDDKRTQLAPVPADRVAQYEKMLAAGHFVDVIAGAEVSIARNPFWLTGHRLTDQALARLGHTAARNAVLHEVRALVSRLPSVVELKFSDGTPFADTATRAWIESEVIPAGEPGTNAGGGGGGGDTWRSLLEAVAADARPDDPLDLFARLDAALTAERDPRRRFLWSMALAQACLDAGQSALARAQLERLDQQFRALGLDAWEPSLGADLAAALARAGGGGSGRAASDTPSPSNTTVISEEKD